MFVSRIDKRKREESRVLSCLTWSTLSLSEVRTMFFVTEQTSKQGTNINNFWAGSSVTVMEGEAEQAATPCSHRASTGLWESTASDRQGPVAAASRASPEVGP